MRLTSICGWIALASLMACGGSDPAPAPAKEAAPVEEAAPAEEAAVEEAAAEEVAAVEAAPHEPDAANGAVKFTEICVSCHGEGGAGDGIAGAALDPKPADFTDAAFWESRDDDHLRKAITEGGPAVGKSPLMAPWGALLSQDEVTDVIAHLKTLKK